MLNEADRVKLALALEMVGRQQEAINILEEAHAGSTELTGVLAGRYKRRWLADPDGLDAEGKRALDLYNQAYRMAAQKGDHQQAFYNGINVAFLDLALLNHLEDARMIAREVLKHCTQAPQEKWRFATEGEAHLYLDNMEASLSGYAKALESNPDAREIDSMRKQALWASRLLGSQLAEAQLAALFQTLPGDDPNAKWSG